MIKRYAKVLLPALAGVGLVFSAVAANAAPVGTLKIVEYGFNAPGTDTTSNRNAEFVRFVNTTAAAVDVEGWTLHDSYQTAGGDWGNRYTFHASALPAGSPFKVDADGSGTGTVDHFVVPAGGQVYVYTGSGVDSTPTNNTAAIYRNFKHYLNNAGDTIYIRDADGNVISKIEYTSYRVKITQ